MKGGDLCLDCRMWWQWEIMTERQKGARASIAKASFLLRMVANCAITVNSGEAVPSV